MDAQRIMETAMMNNTQDKVSAEVDAAMRKQLEEEGRLSPAEMASPPPAGEPRRWPCVMVDLETLGLGEDAAILEIGAVCFDLETGEVGPASRWRASLESNEEFGRKIDAGTLAWWLAEGDRAYYFTERCREVRDLYDGLSFFVQWLRDNWTQGEGGTIWARGNKDVAWLEHALESVLGETKMPWEYWQVMDQRSVLAWEGIKPFPREVGSQHDALADAQAQVVDLIRAAKGRRKAETSDGQTSDARLEDVPFRFLELTPGRLGSFQIGPYYVAMADCPWPIPIPLGGSAARVYEAEDRRSIPGSAGAVAVIPKLTVWRIYEAGSGTAGASGEVAGRNAHGPVEDVPFASWEEFFRNCSSLTAHRDGLASGRDEERYVTGSFRIAESGCFEAAWDYLGIAKAIDLYRKGPEA